MKSVALLSANAPDAVSWLLKHAERSAKSCAGLRRVTVQVGVPDLAGRPPQYDAVLEVWDEAGGASDEMIDSVAGRFAVERYSAEEMVAKPAERRSSVGITLGIASLSFIRAKPALTRAEVLRRWSEHASLACDIHWGMTRYVQNRFKVGAGTPTGWFGMAHLHFPNAAATRHGLFRTAEDRAVITADVAEFVADHATMQAVEHVVRI